LDTETFHHTGYRLTRNDLRDLREAIRSCPDPTSSRCPCPAHQRLSQTDASGRWDALHDLDTTEAFPIEKGTPDRSPARLDLPTNTHRAKRK
jgi:hypothetical protein